MRRLIFLFVILAAVACVKQKPTSSLAEINWKIKSADLKQLKGDTTMESASTYLSVYPQVFNVEESTTQALTATVSMRNTSREDTIFISSAKYYNTKGELIRVYFDYPIYLLPLETDQIIIAHKDNEGGTGANFIFDWQKKEDTSDPIFEAVMLSTYGQQGISFTTQGVRIR